MQPPEAVFTVADFLTLSKGATDQITDALAIIFVVVIATYMIGWQPQLVKSFLRFLLASSGSMQEGLTDEQKTATQARIQKLQSKVDRGGLTVKEETRALRTRDELTQRLRA